MKDVCDRVTVEVINEVFAKLFPRPIESCRDSSPGRACRDRAGRDGSTGGRIGVLARSTRSVLGRSPQAPGTRSRE